MPDYSDENSEHYDGDYNGKPIVYEEGLHDLFKQKADLTEADRKLLADSELPADLAGAKVALDEIAKIPLNLAQMGAGIWNLWVKLNKWRWLQVEHKYDRKAHIRIKDPKDEDYQAVVIKFHRGLVKHADGKVLIIHGNFREYIFPIVNFHQVRFTIGTDFTDAVFQGYTSFQGVDFEKSTILGSVFCSDVIFLGVSFQNKTYFSELVFHKKAEFKNVKFSHQIQFFEVSAYGDTVFDDVTFARNVEFRDVVFYGKTVFDAVKLKGINPYLLVFNGPTKFKETEFLTSVKFDEVVFTSEVDFSQSTFESSASFKQTVFLDSVIFNDTKFKQHVEFNSTYFLGKVDFKNARLNGYVDFDHAWFGKTVDTPKPNVYDSDSYISDWGNIFQKVYKDIPVIDSESMSIPDFKGTEFKLSPNLGYTNIPLPPQPLTPREKGDGKVQSAWRHLRRFIGIDQRYIRIKDANAASKFRRLQELAAQGHNHHAEAKFFRAELLAKRGHETSGRREVFLINLFEAVCECGLNARRPLWILFWVSTLLFMPIYTYHSTIEIWQLYSKGAAEIWGHLISYTLSNAASFIGVFRGNDTVAVEVLYGGPAGISFGNSFLAGTHNLISSILLFLALLAVRNYFKMR